MNPSTLVMVRANSVAGVIAMKSESVGSPSMRGIVNSNSAAKVGRLLIAATKAIVRMAIFLDNICFSALKIIRFWSVE